ncbi:MAG: glycosyltransferase family 2 protein [Bacteroidia bacterium]|nr:glycosyltransferase family 2 protein [Bacteroidia bacterium]
MTSQPIILSIIIISHNQRSELKRCVDSVLAQNIPFEYEIILSDDRSDDGTFELAKEYEIRFPNIIKASQCNSDVCNPANNSQRSGYNRCNGYKLTTGKYIAHADADDYFIEGSHIYQRQVEMLEKHPECSLCMQNVWILKEGDPIETGREWGPQSRFDDGRIISAEEFIKGDYFILNQAFIQRRNPNSDPTALYGKRYVDSIITYHHLLFGPIVCVDACDYIYMKHPDAVTTSMKLNDITVLWNLQIYISAVVPDFADMQIKCKPYEILLLVNQIRQGIKISDTAKNSLNGLDVFLYHCCQKSQLDKCEKIRLFVSRIALLCLIHFHLNTKCMRKLIYNLVITTKKR